MLTETIRIQMGMGVGMGGNWKCFSGINGNGIEVSEFQRPEMGIGMKSSEWDEMVC